MTETERIAAHCLAALELADVGLTATAIADPHRFEASIRAVRIILQDHRLATPSNPILVMAYEKVLEVLERARERSRAA